MIVPVASFVCTRASKCWVYCVMIENNGLLGFAPRRFPRLLFNQGAADTWTKLLINIYSKTIRHLNQRPTLPTILITFSTTAACAACRDASGAVVGESQSNTPFADSVISDDTTS